VANTPDYCVEEVALHALALALALLRGVVEHDGAIRAGRWEPVGAHPPAVRASETSIGVLGFGRVGRRVVRGAAGLGFSVLVHDPLVGDDVIAAAGARPVALDELFAASDLVSLHAPLTAATRRVVDERTLSLMRPGARIVNTTRGGLVDQDALVAALHDGRLGGAALDVFADEPLPPDAPLRHAPRTVLTAHAAWYSPAALRELPRRAAENLARLLAGDDVPAVLNPGHAAAGKGH
jgi:phosphoglycerate dehydrogenase-like enzyme